ncbi:MAG TPA: hypothetical protein VJ486_09920 [Geothrix sp.]|nr:hypothetical protein [Geothrix sp.]
MARKAYRPRSPKPLTPVGPRHQAEGLESGPATALPEAQEALPPGVDRNLLLELRAQQTDLDRQKEELRQSQLELEMNRARHFDLYDLAPVGYRTLSDEGLILESNQMTAKLLGVDRHTLFKQPFSNHIVPEEVDNDHLRHHQG